MQIINRLLLTALLSNVTMAEVDFDIGGEGVAYYQTDNSLENDFFSQERSRASVGLQLELKFDLGHDFNLGYQETFLGTLGLEKNLISSARQYAKANDLNGRAMTKLYVSKQQNNTLLKLGRQALSMTVSPLAFSENWNVFENTFDAAVLVNKDIIDTTIVAAYIANANNHNDLSAFKNLSADAEVLNAGMLMLTVQNKSLENLLITATYYRLNELAGAKSGSALWLDIKSKHTPVKMGFQAGQIDPSNRLDKTTAFGAKASGKYENFGVSLAYSSVDDGAVSLQNYGTRGDVALYTQMVNNQDFIALNADTVVLKGVAKLPLGNLTIGYGVTKDNSLAKNDFTELDVVYKFDLLDTKMFVGYIGQTANNKVFAGEDRSDNIRVWSRYTF